MRLTNENPIEPCPVVLLEIQFSVSRLDLKVTFFQSLKIIFCHSYPSNTLSRVCSDVQEPLIICAKPRHTKWGPQIFKNISLQQQDQLNLFRKHSINQQEAGSEI